MRKILTLHHFAYWKTVWLLVRITENSCILPSTVNLSQFCTQVPDKITQLRLYFIFQTATKHSWLEDQMVFWLFTKSLTQRKPKTFIWEATESLTLPNRKEKYQVCWPHQSKMNWWLVWALEWSSKCHWTKMKSQGANMQSNHSTRTALQALIFVWENL